MQIYAAKSDTGYERVNTRNKKWSWYDNHFGWNFCEEEKRRKEKVGIWYLPIIKQTMYVDLEAEILLDIYMEQRIWN